MEKKLTPAQAQYQKIKEKYPDAIVFFRMGDFYEMFGEDARTGAKVLGLTLTSRDKSASNPVPMAGVPYHAVNKYIARLAKSGYKVALCEQLTDSSLPGIVERDVVRVITPGTIVEDEMLDDKRNNYLACIAEQNNRFGLSYLDSSTGDFFVLELDSLELVRDELFSLSPAEILFSKKHFAATDFMETVKKSFQSHVAWFELLEDPTRVLLDHFQVKTLSGFGVEHARLGLIAAGNLLAYVRENQKTELSHIIALKPVFRENHMHLDESTIRNLELVSNSYDGRREGSLLSVLDRTCTSAGGRLMYRWILTPLLHKEPIEERLEAVDFLAGKVQVREVLLSHLKNVFDIERILAKMVMKKALPRDLIALKQTLGALPAISQLFQESRKEDTGIQFFAKIREDLRDTSLEKVYALIDQTVDEAVLSGAQEGHIIKKGYHPEIDDFRSILFEGKDWMMQYQKKEQERSGISTLKVAFNNVFGYYIEISKGQAAKAPADFVRKQTLVNAERFITPELKLYEEKVLGAEEKLLQLEQKLLLNLQSTILEYAAPLKKLALALAQLDVILSFAVVATDRHYVRPLLTDHAGGIHITAGRHPVVESFLDSPFVHNDLSLEKEKRIVLLTGPNMAGKSTYLRQNALIILMSQLGSFVPASSATIDICDRIFTRIGASDVLVKGQSTFLVEMQETANILNNATEKSFIILDEVGRGTSTYDGLSLAWSIFEYLHTISKARVLFATHYHELIALAEQLGSAVNASMAVTENSDGVIFLRKVVAGGVDKSYGIEVAKISGLPPTVIERAKDVLSTLEKDKKQAQTSSSQLSFLEPQVIETVKLVKKDSEVEKKLSQLDLDGLTPLQALNVLHEMKKEIGK